MGLATIYVFYKLEPAKNVSFLLFSFFILYVHCLIDLNFLRFNEKHSKVDKMTKKDKIERKWDFCLQ